MQTIRGLYFKILKKNLTENPLYIYIYIPNSTDTLFFEKHPKDVQKMSLYPRTFLRHYQDVPLKFMLSVKKFIIHMNYKFSVKIFQKKFWNVI